MKNLLYICLALLAFSPSLIGQVPHYPIVTGDSTGIGIAYHNLDPDLEVYYNNNDGDSIWLDLDLDNVPDLCIYLEFYNTNWSYRNRLEVIPLPGTEIFCQVDSSPNIPQYYPIPAAIGFSVDSTAAWVDAPSYLYAIYGAPPNYWAEYFYWLQLHNRFLCFRISKPTGVYYGWMRVFLKDDETSIGKHGIFQSWAISNGQTVGRVAPAEHLNGISCGPLPTEGQLHLYRNSGALPLVDFSLVDANGRVVREWKMPTGQKSVSENLDGLNAGIYFLRGVSGNETRTWKVVKR